MSATRNIKLNLEYDGTNYQGWQVQPDVPTVQGALERAVRRITGEEVRVTGAGRTDAGVHALGQAAHFVISNPMPVDRLRSALNAVLPEDVVVREAEEADNDFHARYSAKGKWYRYTIFNRPSPPALDRGTALHVHYPLDVPAMKRAARELVGTFDFSSFACNTGEEENPVRTVTRIDIRKEGDYITIDLEAISFLYKMARSIVGTLLDVGRGKMRPEEMREALLARERGKAGATAPARGLCLMRVDY